MSTNVKPSSAAVTGEAPEAVTAATVVHVYDAGLPLCFTKDRNHPGPLWTTGPLVRQHDLANCPDCLEAAS